MKNNPTTLILLQVLIELIPTHHNEVCVMRWLRNFGFDQAYLKDENNQSDYGFPVIFLKFSLRNGQPPTIHSHLTKNKWFVEVYDIDINSLVYVFKIPDIYHKDYQIFISGKYSKHTEEFRKLFFNDPNFIAIFNKDEILRKKISSDINVELPEDAEVWTKWWEVTDHIPILN